MQGTGGVGATGGTAGDTAAGAGAGGTEIAGQGGSTGGTGGTTDSDLTFLSETDRDPEGVALSADRLSGEWLGLANYGVRSTRSIAAGQGVFYFEVYADLELFNVGVATAQASLHEGAGTTDAGFGVDVSGVLLAPREQDISAFSRSPQGEYGFVVDYRGTHPDIYIIAGTADQPRLLASRTLTTVSDPLFIHLSGLRRRQGYQATINPGNDVTNRPFTFDPTAVLSSAGHADVAGALVLGWGASHQQPWNEPPLIGLNVTPPASISVGDSVTLSASAADAEDGDHDAQIVWDVLSTGIGPEHVWSTGPTFTFRPSVIGLHPIVVSVTDRGGKRAEQTFTIEATGSLPQLSDVHLVDEGSLTGAGIELSSDGLRAHWTQDDKLGVRANQGLYGDFWYVEGHALVPEDNQAIGLVIGGVSLNPYRFNVTPPSCSVNAVGPSMYHDLMFVKSFPEPGISHYGLAVDYRGTYPVVYAIVGGRLAGVLELPDVTVPVYPMLYGNVNGHGAAYDMEINFGGTSFHEDPVGVLNSAGIDASGLKLCWGNNNATCH